MIDAKTIAELRRATGAGIMDCRKALEESNGDMEAAIDHLRKQGQKAAAKREDRTTSEGLIHAYIHGEGKTGVLVEVLCETDFVARNDDFKGFVHDIAMHVAATNPLYLTPEDVPAENIEREKDIYKEQMAGESKPVDVMEKIMEGKLNKYYEDICLMNQKFIKDDEKTIADVVTEQIAKTGEKIEIKRFARFAI